MDLIQWIQNASVEYLNAINKAERKKIGQFFTPKEIAKYMGGLAEVNDSVLHVLDAGAGMGILSAAILERVKSFGCVKLIHLDLYENNSNILPFLEKNLQYLEKDLKKHQIELKYRIINQNFILNNADAWKDENSYGKYDIVISNPPYKKISKSEKEANAMKEIVYGQPNLYFLFMAMCVRLLKKEGQFIFIVPRSFSSGLYFTLFRKWFFCRTRLQSVHLFEERDKVFHCDPILQETVIIKGIRTKKKEQALTISKCSDAGTLGQIDKIKAPYDLCVREDENCFLFLPADQSDAEALCFVNRWKYTLSDLGYKMKTGTVVDFRAEKWLRVKRGKKTIPLLWAYNFEENQIKFPKKIKDKPQYLSASADNAALQMKTANYVLIKRFTSKEEQKRLQCALLFKKDFDAYENICAENHLNFITKMDGEMTIEEMYGLFVIMNSKTMDQYFRILNGSTQVNANEINAIPFPSINEVVKMGKMAMNEKILSEQLCEKILRDAAGLE